MPDGDVASTLGELERKLKELEDELHAPSTVPVARAEGTPSSGWRTAAASPSRPVPQTEVWPAPAAPSPAPAARAPWTATSPPAPAAPPAPDAQTQLRELVHFRTELERSAEKLMTEYERVLGSLRATTGASAPPPSFDSAAPSPPVVPAVDAPRAPAGFPPHAPSPLAGPSPSELHAPPASAAPQPWQPAPTAVSNLFDDSVMDGAITVDAGPFTDITVLSGFEQALGAVPGVREVYVRGFEGSRALIDVTLGQPVALGTELRRIAPVNFSIIAADAGRLSVAIQGA